MVSDADLHESVAAHHERVDPAAWENTYVVGDVHGCLDELRDLLAELTVAETDLVLFVGDLVLKGPDTAGVLELVRGRENMRAVRGNGEQQLLEDEQDRASVGTKGVAQIESMPVAISWDESLLVHGGIDPTRPLSAQDVDALLTCRAIPPENGYDGPFWFERYEGPPRVFFGHTVVETPVATDWCVGLDTGCVYGGRLTAYDVGADSFVSVSARRTYQIRADKRSGDAEQKQ